MKDSYLRVFQSILLHPRRFCKENEDWNGMGNLLKFGIYMLLLSIGIHLLRIATTSFIRNIDIFVALYSVFLFNLLLPITVFITSATVLNASLYIFNKPNLKKTLAALEVSSVVLVIWSITQFIAIRMPLSFTYMIVLIGAGITIFWGLYTFFQAFQNAHELNTEKAMLILGVPLMSAAFLLFLKPDLLKLLDILHDFAWRIPTYFGYLN